MGKGWGDGVGCGERNHILDPVTECDVCPGQPRSRCRYVTELSVCVCGKRAALLLRADRRRVVSLPRPLYVILILPTSTSTRSTFTASQDGSRRGRYARSTTGSGSSRSERPCSPSFPLSLSLLCRASVAAASRGQAPEHPSIAPPTPCHQHHVLIRRTTPATPQVRQVKHHLSLTPKEADVLSTLEWRRRGCLNRGRARTVHSGAPTRHRW